MSSDDGPAQFFSVVQRGVCAVTRTERDAAVARLAPSNPTRTVE